MALARRPGRSSTGRATAAFSTVVTFPFLKKLLVDLGVLYIPFVAVVVVGSSNAVNLTDGLDGLAIGAVGHRGGDLRASSRTSRATPSTARYLQIPFIPQSGELAVFCGALVGASLGFLWFNCHPAEMFMGDVGALSLGAAIAAVAVMTKQEVLLAIVGGLFVLEALSVIIQVASFKLDRASASSRWRRSTTTSSCSGGRSRASSSGSGSSRSSSRSSGLSTLKLR